MFPLQGRRKEGTLAQGIAAPCLARSGRGHVRASMVAASSRYASAGLDLLA